MNYAWEVNLRSHGRTAAASLPPALVDETAWDILLALHAKDDGSLSLTKLGSIVSVPQPALNQWLALLQDRELLTGARYGEAQEARAVLTSAGLQLLDCYLSVTSALQIGAHD